MTWALPGWRVPAAMHLLPLTLALAAPVVARTPPPDTTAPDPARLAAAERLLRVLMTPERFQALLDQAAASMRRTALQAYRANPMAAAMVGDDPRVERTVERHLARFTADTIAAMRGQEGEMRRVMARAYARRFTVVEMAEVERFFATPTGQLYLDRGTTIMADPDVAAWQAQMLNAQMARVPAMLDALLRDLTAERTGRRDRPA